MAPIDLFDLVAKISLDTSEYESGLSGATTSATSFASKVKSGLVSGVKAGATAIAGLTTGAVALGGTVVKLASNTASYGDNIDKMSQKMGLSSDAYQEWDFIMQHCGTSIESMQASMKTLSSAAETGSDAFDKLGLSQEEIANMSQEELFGATISALQNVESDTQRTYLAGQLLGRGATELGALLNTSAEDTEAMRKQVHELGGVMSGDAVKNAAAFQDSLQNLQTVFSGAKNAILGDFLPSLTSVMDGLTLMFSGDSSGLGMVKQGISDFVNNLTKALPDVISAGAEIVVTLATAIAENLPELVDAAIDAIEIIGQGLIDNAPTLADSAIEIVTSIANAIIENGPAILETAIQTLVDVIANIFGIPEDSVNGFFDSIEKVVNGVKNFVSAIKKGITQSTLFQSVMDAVGTVVDALKGIFDSVKNALDVFTGAADDAGITWDTVWNAISEVVTWVANVVGDVIGILADRFASWAEGVSAAIDTVVAIFSWLVEQAQTDGTLISTVWDNIQLAIDTVITIVTGVIEALIQLLQGDFSGAWETIKETISHVWDNIKEAINNAIDFIVGFMADAWDSIKTTASNLWDSIKTAISDKIDAAKTAVSDTVNNIKTKLSDTWNNIKTTASNTWNNIKTAVTTPINNAKTAISTTVDNIKTKLSNTWSNIKNTATNTWNSIKTAIETPINNAKTAVQNAIDAIKSKFNFTWSLPHLKMPHPYISGHFSLNPPSVPHFGISWYKKAMDNAMLLNGATIFGAYGNTLLGGGEAGPEVVAGANTLMDMMREAVGGSNNQAVYNITVNGGDFGDREELAEYIALELEKQRRMRGAALAY